jgi:hypothetical protein
MTGPDPIAILKDFCQHMERADTAWNSQEWFRQRSDKLFALASAAPALLAVIEENKTALAQFQLTLAV